MKRPSILAGIAFAFTAAVFAIPLWWGFKTALPFFLAFRLINLTAYLTYCLYLLWTARSRVGTLSLTAANLLIGMLLCWLPVGSPTMAGALAVLISVNRSLLFHRNLAAIACDGLVALLGLSLGGYLFAASASMPAALWSFFLLQSVFVMIPSRPSERAGLFPAGKNGEEVDPFVHGQRQAEAALQRIVQEGGN